MKKLKVGDVVTLAMPMLECNPGTRGVIYDVYKDFDDPNKRGVSIIFENGKYDGFSHEDQQVFLNEEHVQYVPFYINDYKFTNVMRLSKDYKNGLWDEVFI